MQYLKPTISRSAILLASIVVTATNGGEPILTLNQKDDGYRGIWYMNQPSGDEYVYKYSGGLGTYCAKHRPFAVYCAEVDKTFFCYGGTTKDSNRRLLHMVSYFDHKTKCVQWSQWQRLAAIEEGHYQISAVGRGRAGSAFNYHPQGKGLNWRTNLY